jgi:riboflavin biosynthesis pyrimidine reductase
LATVPRMRFLRPDGPGLDDRDAVLAHLDEDRPDPPPDRPWVTTNMVMSLDGAYRVAGTSGGLSSEADHLLFLAQRSLADAIVVGASTVREERYRRPSVDPAAARIRARRGQEPVPTVVIASKSLRLPADLPLLEGKPPVPVMAHPRSSDPSTAPQGVELLAVGDDDVDFTELLAALGRRGARHVVCEGGPGVLGQMAAADLIDEYLLTLSPRLVGGSSVGLLAGAEATGGPHHLHRVLGDGDHLMLSYRRTGAPGAARNEG